MPTENQDDNKSKADNKATEERVPNLPPDPAQETEQAKVPEPQDPDMQKWIEETKDLPNAYKRVRGSREEVEKYRTQLEEAQRAHQQYQEQIANELRDIVTKNPDVAKAFGIEVPAEPSKGQEPKYDPSEVARQIQAQVEVNNFKERNAQYIKDDQDWGAIQDIAVSFVGKQDTDGKPYTIQTALRDALLIRHKELIGDKAISEHLTSQAKRASASESGDLPAGSPSGDELTEEEKATAAAMGLTITPEVKQRMLEHRKKQ